MEFPSVVCLSDRPSNTSYKQRVRLYQTDLHPRPMKCCQRHSGNLPWTEKQVCEDDIDQPRSSLSADTKDDSEEFDKSEETRRGRYDFRFGIFKRKLMLAATTNNIEMLTIALNRGISPNISDQQGRTALHFASGRGYAEIVDLLLKRGANPNCKDCIGNTPLHLAAVTSKISVITLLLKAGTDPLSPDHHGFNPLQLAETKLRLLQNCKGDDMNRVKSEVHNVVNMLTAFLEKRKGFGEQVEALSGFCSRLTLSNTSDEVENDVQDLLANIDHLKLNS